MSSRAWPRCAAPHRSSAPHDSRTVGHAARPPMLAAGKKVRRLRHVAPHTAPAETAFLIMLITSLCAAGPPVRSRPARARPYGPAFNFFLFRGLWPPEPKELIPGA